MNKYFARYILYNLDISILSLYIYKYLHIDIKPTKASKPVAVDNNLFPLPGLIICPCREPRGAEISMFEGEARVELLPTVSFHNI